MKNELSSRDQEITWPPESMAVLVADDGWYLIARNTNQNLHRIAAAGGATLGSKIALESTIIAFKKDDVDNLNMGLGISKKTLFELRQKDRSKLISTAHAVTSGGQEVTVKNIREITYPAEQLIGAGTNQSCNLRMVAPDTFNTREIGTILQAVPEADEAGKLISVTLKSEWITLNGWEKHEVVTGNKDGLKKFSVRMPIFDSSSIETQLRITSGDTVLLGGGKGVEPDWIYYHFLKAETVRPTRLQQVGEPKENAQQ
jgi:type II secretory pathway component GspD/PulD (secretin)